MLAWLLAPLLVLWAVGSVVAYFLAINFANIAYDRALFESTRSLAEQVRIVENKAFVELPRAAMEILLSDVNDRVYFKVTGRRGQLVAGDSTLPAPGESFIPDLPVFHDGFMHGESVRIASLYMILPEDPRPILVQVAQTLKKRHILANEILAGMILPQLALILLAALIVWLGVGRGLSPLQQLREKIASRSHRDLRPVEELNAPQEMQPIVHAINDLMARLSTAIDAQQRFIADAAHQLRTPLAGLKAQITVALKEHDPEQRQLALRQLNTSSERTIRLVNQMLALARVEPGADKLGEARPIDLNTLAREATREWVPAAIRKQIDLGFEGSTGPASLSGEEISLKMLLDNLIDNALRYSPSGSHVTVRVKSGDTTTLEVEDNGPGIPLHARDQVFERFYRISQNEEGSGLGLAIVREIVHLHQARITLETPPDGQGALVRVVFGKMEQNTRQEKNI